jgi:hypothetical protein
LTPPQLLERTQAATGETELHDMQKKLMEWRNQEKSLEKVRKNTQYLIKKATEN